MLDSDLINVIESLHQSGRIGITVPILQRGKLRLGEAAVCSQNSLLRQIRQTGPITLSKQKKMGGAVLENLERKLTFASLHQREPGRFSGRRG